MQNSTVKRNHNTSPPIDRSHLEKYFQIFIWIRGVDPLHIKQTRIPGPLPPILPPYAWIRYVGLRGCRLAGGSGQMGGSVHRLQVLWITRLHHRTETKRGTDWGTDRWHPCL